MHPEVIKIKNWLIKKLGGFTLEEMQKEIVSTTEVIDRAKEILREELKVIPVEVRGDHPDINKGLQAQQTFINAMCKFLKVKNIW